MARTLKELIAADECSRKDVEEIAEHLLGLADHSGAHVIAEDVFNSFHGGRIELPDFSEDVFQLVVGQLLDAKVYEDD